MTTNYDVVVIGAGPAGSTAARECAAAGLKTALVDKAEFPRDKPCGGGVTPKAARMLPFDLTPVVERTIRSVRFTCRPGLAITRNAAEPVTFLTQRSRLDAFLLEQAVATGVRVFERAPLRALDQQAAAYRVEAGSVTLRARVVIGADGANGITARLAGLNVSRWSAVALEGNISVSSAFPDLWRETMGIDFRHSPSGYGWLFPKGDHLNIGIGGAQSMGPRLRQNLRLIARNYGYNPDDLSGLRGHTLPIRRPGSALAGDSVLLVGDAAGILDPFTGEGICAAIWSGRAAAARAADIVAGDASATERYVHDVEQTLIPDLRVSRKLFDLFHLCPALWTQGLRHPRVWRLAQELLQGTQTYSGAREGSGWKTSLLSYVYETLKLTSRGEASRYSARLSLHFGT